MIAKSRIIVFHTIKHGDSGLVIQGYSDTAGRTAVYLRGAARKSTVLSNLHKLNILDIVTYSNGSSMPVIREMTPAVQFPSLRTDILKSTIAIFLCELLAKAVRETGPDPALFRFLSSSVQVLEHTREGVANFHLHFLVHLCKISGFMPLDNYGPCTPVFCIPAAGFGPPPDLRARPGRPGGGVCPQPPQGRDDSAPAGRAAQVPEGGNGFLSEEDMYFSPAESELLHRILNTPVTGLGRIGCTGAQRLAFARRMIRYLSHHLGTRIEIKSLDILHEVFK